MVLSVVRTAMAMAALVAAVSAARAQGTPCTTGPGAAFGVTAYSCANCGVKTEPGRPTIFVFNAEPVVLEADATSGLRTGDVIVKVNGKAITTREGADQFTYPKPGAAVVVFRRSGALVSIAIRARDCPPAGKTAARTETGQARPATRDGRGIAPRMAVATGRVQTDATGRFGFAVGCRPSCTRVRGANGTDYWKFDGEPPIVDLRAGSPAEKAGMQIGDRIVEVDGMSVLSEQGAMRLLNAQTERALRLVVVRGDRRMTLDLRVEP